MASYQHPLGLYSFDYPGDWEVDYNAATAGVTVLSPMHEPPRTGISLMPLAVTGTPRPLEEGLAEALERVGATAVPDSVEWSEDRATVRAEGTRSGTPDSLFRFWVLRRGPLVLHATQVGPGTRDAGLRRTADEVVSSITLAEKLPLPPGEFGRRVVSALREAKPGDWVADPETWTVGLIGGDGELQAAMEMRELYQQCAVDPDGTAERLREFATRAAAAAETPPVPAGRRRLILFARDPEPGEVLTDLCPPLTLEEAARLSEAFLVDEVETFRELSGVRVTVAHAPGDAGPRFRRILGEEMVPWLAPQGPGDLGRRLLAAFAHACPTWWPVVVVGSDVPDLPPSRIAEAFRVLETDEADVVIGPAVDGGVYLVGARQAHAHLFEAVPWGTPGVLAALLQRSEESGLRPHLLPLWEEVQSPEDLRRLRDRLREAPPLVAPRTRAVLRSCAI